MVRHLDGTGGRAMTNPDYPQTQFMHLNVENSWPGFRFERLETGRDGELILARVPKIDARLGELPANETAIAGPAGIGVDLAGNVYFSDPVGHRIFKWD